MKICYKFKRIIYCCVICFSFFDIKCFAKTQEEKRNEQMKNLTVDSIVGDIVADRCSLSRVFEKYKIDYCCGGKLSLKEACLKEGVEAAQVLNELKTAMCINTDEKSWNDESLSALIDHIQTTHHNNLWTELPMLAVIVEKVARVHGARHPEVIEIRDIYVKLQPELEEHLRKEENIVFPFIKKLEAAEVSSDQMENPLHELEEEHDAAGEAFHKLREITHDFQPPEDACNTYRAMLSRLNELESDMHRHVHKENSILFPRARLLKGNSNKL